MHPGHHARFNTGFNDFAICANIVLTPKLVKKKLDTSRPDVQFSRMKRFWLIIALLFPFGLIADNVTPPDIAPQVTYLFSNSVFTPHQVQYATFNTYLPANGPAHPIGIWGQVTSTASGANAQTGSNYTATLYPAMDVINPFTAGSGTNFFTNSFFSMSNAYTAVPQTQGTNIPGGTWEPATTYNVAVSNSLSTNANLTLGITQAP